MKKQADAGSPHAACRLAFELLRCQVLIDDRDLVMRWLESREAKADELGMPHGANDLATNQIEAATRAADCKVLPPSAYRDASNYLFQAANGGVAEAQVRYITGQMFGAVSDSLLRVPDNGYLHHPEFDRWRRLAPTMAQNLVRTHRSVGLTLMGRAYGSDELPFDALIPDDPLLDWVYVEAVRRENGRPPRSLDHFSAEEKVKLAQIETELGFDSPSSEADPMEDSLLDAMGGPGTALGQDAGVSCN